jgi:hypothetical protein
VSRSGYTGEDGFEIMCEGKDALALTEAMMATGEVSLPRPASVCLCLCMFASLCLPIYLCLPACLPLSSYLSAAVCLCLPLSTYLVCLSACPLLYLYQPNPSSASSRRSG